jgi:hypothetical protein
MELLSAFTICKYLSRRYQILFVRIKLSNCHLKGLCLDVEELPSLRIQINFSTPFTETSWVYKKSGLKLTSLKVCAVAGLLNKRGDKNNLQH